jgi:tetratricopeptide (TPR) repeat protein
LIEKNEFPAKIKHMTTSDHILQQPHFRVDPACGQALEDFKQVTRQYALFHITFFSIAVLELVAFVLFFSFLTKTTIFAFSLAGLFLTGFAYFVLLFYFQAKKPNQLLEVRTNFLEASRSCLPFENKTCEYHLGLAAALERLLSHLHRLEYSYYEVPVSFKTLSPLMQKFSAWTHWKDLHQMKELLLLMIIKQQIEFIKLQPTHLEAHARLASTYLNLSKLYMDPRELYPDEEHFWVSPEYASAEMLENFKQASLRAIEEYKILDSYAPNAPWVHAQLAVIYHNLNLFHEEMREYEMILKISPNDRQVLLRLGVLYFKQGQSAQGLRIYEQLKKSSDDSKADELIAHYDSALHAEHPEI